MLESIECIGIVALQPVADQPSPVLLVWNPVGGALLDHHHPLLRPGGNHCRTITLVSRQWGANPDLAGQQRFLKATKRNPRSLEQPTTGD